MAKGEQRRLEGEFRPEQSREGNVAGLGGLAGLLCGQTGHKGGNFLGIC
jgi:hypothetical protein